MYRKILFRMLSFTTYPKIIEIGEETPVLYNYNYVVTTTLNPICTCMMRQRMRQHETIGRQRIYRVN